MAAIASRELVNGASSSASTASASPQPSPQPSPRKGHVRRASKSSGASSSSGPSKARSRSFTQSTGNTSLTRPSTSTDRSLTFDSSMYNLPASHSAGELAESPMTDAPPAVPTGWKTVVRKASGRFRRSVSSNSLAVSESSSVASSPRKERVRSVSHNDAPVTPTEEGSGMFHLLTRRRSSTNLKIGKAGSHRQQQWENLPPSPSFNLTKDSLPFKLGGKGKQKLEQVTISPFQIDFSTPADEPPSLHVPQRQHGFRRSSSESSFRDPSCSSGIPRSNSTSGALEHAHLRNTSNRSPPPPSPLSTSSSSSDAGDRERHLPFRDIPPVPPVPVEHRLKGLGSSTSTVHTTSSQSSSAKRPSVDIVPQRASSADSQPIPTIRFPTFFNFVPRPDEIDGRDEVFGSSASAIEHDLVLPAVVDKPALPPRNPLRSSALPPRAGEQDDYVPPRRSESLFRPLDMPKGRPTIEPGPSSPVGARRKDKRQAFEDLLSGGSTLKISGATFAGR